MHGVCTAFVVVVASTDAKADADVAADIAAAAAAAASAGQPDACPGLLKLPQHLHKV